MFPREFQLLGWAAVPARRCSIYDQLTGCNSVTPKQSGSSRRVVMHNWRVVVWEHLT